MFSAVLFGFFTLSCAFRLHPEFASESPFDTAIGYRNYNEMTQVLQHLSYTYSNLSSLYSIGKTVGEKEIWVLKISSPNLPIVGSPQVKFVGNIHGNEAVGRELILYFAEYLLKNHNTDSEVRWLLENTAIHLLPSLNPDGFERAKEGVCHSGPGRENGNFVDLNRSFPDHFNDNKIPLQPETFAMSQWMSQVPFVLSASFHGGALVANYPYDSNPGNEREILSPHSSLTPDDDVFKHLAQTYSNSHLTMHKGKTCNDNQPAFPGGITNGAAWYSLTGGMQDYNYVAHGCMELTLEVSCCKYPEARHLPRLWDENKRAMMELLKQSQMGVKGMVVDKITSAYIPGAVLRVSGRSVPFYSSENGEFWRILLPGDYLLIVEAKGYETQSFPFTVKEYNATRPSPTWLGIFLRPADDLITAASSNLMQTSKDSATSVTFSLPIVFLTLIWNLS